MSLLTSKQNKVKFLNNIPIKHINMYEKRDLIGKVFFGAAILILLYMFISPLTHTIINVDEYWTYSLVNLPFMQGIIEATFKM